MRHIIILFLAILFLFPNLTCAEENWINFTNMGVKTVYALAVQDGCLWAGTDRGVIRWNLDTGEHKKYTRRDGLCADAVYSMVIDSKGKKWFGTAGGVNSFDGTQWISYTSKNGLVNNCVLSIALDKDNKKWFGTRDGVSLYDGKNWTTYTADDGLVDNRINTILIDSQ